MVRDERKKKTHRLDGKSTQDLIDEQGVELCPKNINKHVNAGLAGMSPAKRGRKSKLPQELDEKMLLCCEAASRNFQPLAVGETTAAVNELVEGTEHDGVTGGWTQHFLKRNEEKLFTCFPQNRT